MKLFILSTYAFSSIQTLLLLVLSHYFPNFLYASVSVFFKQYSIGVLKTFLNEFFIDTSLFHAFWYVEGMAYFQASVTKASGPFNIAHPIVLYLRKETLIGSVIGDHFKPGYTLEIFVKSQNGIYTVMSASQRYLGIIRQ